MDKRRLMRPLAAVAFLLCSAVACAQADSLSNELNISLNYLTHGEIRGGGLPKPANEQTVVEDNASFLLGRLRMALDFKNSSLETKAVIQNSAIWGMKGNTSLTLYEGWVKAATRSGLFGQVGRIALAYDDERIIGPNDFAMAALSHDVLRLGYESPLQSDGTSAGHKLHAIVAYNQNSQNMLTGTYYENGAQPYKTMQTVWYHYDVPKVPLGVSLLFMNVGMQAGTPGDKSDPPTTAYQQMFGGYVKYTPRHMTFEASYYRQAGKTGKTQTIDSWMAGVKATAELTPHWGMEMGYDYLSGDDYVAVVVPGGLGMVKHTEVKGFTPVYGSRTQFYGMMDYFYESAYINGFTPGLQNAYVGVTLKPLTNLTCKAIYHYLAVATNLHDLSSTLGHNIDMRVSYRFTKNISLTASYTQMIGTHTMERLKQGTGDKQAHWGWFSLVVKPNLFTTKW